jgi:hypothetical protein
VARRELPDNFSGRISGRNRSKTRRNPLPLREINYPLKSVLIILSEARIYGFTCFSERSQTISLQDQFIGGFIIMRRFKLASFAGSTVIMGLSFAGSAQAAVYAYSANSLLDGFFISNNSANTFGTPIDTSADSATLTGFPSAAFSDVGTGLRDAAPANLGTAAATPNNTFTPLGAVGQYSRGDAAITQEQSNVTSGTGVQSANVAEGNILSGTAAAQGNNSSGTFFNVNLVVTTPGTVTFQFIFDPLLHVALTGAVLPGSLAQAILTASLTITDNATGATVVSWAPDGRFSSVGGTIGGTVASDPYSLNKTLSQLLAGSQTIDDPLGVFRMTTGALPVGTYEVTTEQSERISLTSQEPFPVHEPATLTLLGLGLAGMRFIRRKLT